MENDKNEVVSEIPSNVIGSRENPYESMAQTAGQRAIEAIRIAREYNARSYFKFQEVNFSIDGLGDIQYADRDDENKDLNGYTIDRTRTSLMKNLIDSFLKHDTPEV